MNTKIILELIDGALSKQISFPEIIATLIKEGIESYHVDLIRNEFRYYSKNGDYFLTKVALIHNDVATEFSTEKLEAINQRVQSKQAFYPDFVREGAAAGCAYYIVYLHGKKVRYFGRNGEEYIQYFPGTNETKPSTKNIARSVIKSVDIQANPNTVYNFLSNPNNWPKYAIVNLRSVSSGENGWHNVVTKFGEGKIKMVSVREHGIFDHIWQDPQATWQVYSRIVPNHSGATVMMTFFQPDIMTDEQFDNAMKEMDIEMKKLKEILE